MSTFKRNLEHQRLARAVSLVPGADPTNPPGGPGGNPGGGDPDGGDNNSSTKESSTQKSTSKSTSSSSKTTKEAEPTKKPDTNSETKTESTSTTTTTTSSPSSTTTSSSSPSSSSTKAAPPLTLLNTGTLTYPTNTYTNLPTTTADTDLPTVSSSSEDSHSSTGALNTGAIIGGIAGALGGIALLGIIISFILRRYRNKRRAEEFDAAQFRRSAMIMDNEDPRPVSLFGGRWGGFASSVRNSAGPGMAGRGAYADDADNQLDTQYNDYQTSPTTATGLQPRQQHTYGEHYDSAAARDDDLTHGAYSEQPHQEAVYNLEAYGNYEAYTSNDQNGVQYPAAAHHERHAKDDDPYGGI